MRGVADDEAIRIFLEFDRVEASTKAVVDLNGRFFGGRTVKASFYDVDKFATYKLDLPINTWLTITWLFHVTYFSFMLIQLFEILMIN